jgi:S1-C subfamily serine protease
VAVATAVVGSGFGLAGFAVAGAQASIVASIRAAAIQNALASPRAPGHSPFSRNGVGGPGSGGLGGFGFNGNGGQPSAGGTTGTAPATTATAAEQRGIVDVTSQLGYDHAEGEGTGMVLTSNGEILTNNHVVDGSTSISVTVVSTGKSYSARVVGTDATDDIAVLQLCGASGLSTATLGASSHVSVGDAVVGVGNAGGAGGAPSAVAGRVIALDQTITTQAEGPAGSETLNGLIESNADIRPGDSGGPLYDASGKIIGIDTAAQSGGGSVAGFSIPISDALSIARQIEGGHASSTITIGYPGFLGVEVAPTAVSAAPGFGPGGEQAIQGAVVQGVIGGTAAANAGLAAGDTITAVNGSQITSSAALTAALAGHAPGERVTVSWVDASGASTTATVTLGTGPAA